MDINFSSFTFFKDPDVKVFKSDHVEFLSSLTAPTIIDITGQDTSRCRVITTLLHGNEPSGLIALHRWLSNKNKAYQPATNLRFIICSIEAAQLPPFFTNRYLENGVDINRCFGSELTSGYYLRAEAISNAIAAVLPEVVIDLHNTSGSGPAFGVFTESSMLGLSLASLFCETVILSDIKLGALMEQNFGCAVLTVECGGVQDEKAHLVAYEGICKLADIDLIDENSDHKVSIIRHPLRLKIKADCKLSYRDNNEFDGGVTLVTDIEQFNFRKTTQGEMLGWLDNKGLQNLELLDEKKYNVIDDFFYFENNQLKSKQNLQIFMATSKVKIAMADCLFYIVKL